MVEFQLTRSRGARLATSAVKSPAVYFNSRAHVERDRRRAPAPRATLISTHALTWSATLSVLPSANFTIISTHALTWSATLIARGGLRRSAFQLTRSRGARLTLYFTSSRRIT